MAVKYSDLNAKFDKKENDSLAPIEKIIDEQLEAKFEPDISIRVTFTSIEQLGGRLCAKIRKKYYDWDIEFEEDKVESLWKYHLYFKGKPIETSYR